MCGLVGGTNPQWDYASAIDSLQHRGPDSQRIVPLDKLTLGFARLSIIDPHPVSDQPMASADETVWIVFNGEIYGYQELRRELTAKGRTFRTQSDTEVVLNAYLQWGDDFVDRLDGMFAIALYDRQAGTLKLYRDRVGIKPLYYFFDGKTFAFASELKAIERLCGKQNLTIDKTSVYDFLTYRYIPTPKTLYRNVAKLPAASVLELDVTNLTIKQIRPYWHVPVGDFDTTLSLDLACEELVESIDESVSLQMIADVPVGCFLSGGIDSSVIVSAAVQHDSALQTFSVGFEVPEHTETRFARSVATTFCTQHNETTYCKRDMVEHFPQLRNWYDEPFADHSAFPTSCLSKYARQSVTVALSGDGGDELFGGYRWYSRFKAFKRWGLGRRRSRSIWAERSKATLTPRTFSRRAVGLVAALLGDELGLYAQLLGGMTRGEKLQYAHALEIEKDYDDYWHFRRYWRTDLPLLTRMQFLDFHTFLPDAVLTKVDRASMLHSLEVRVPFLSRKLIEFAFRLPESLRYHGGLLKGLLKQAYRHQLPQNILHREKQGFSPPPVYLPQNGRFQEIVLRQLFAETI
jgi:asparagine synthase (glutamine-hydrolysing)